MKSAFQLAALGAVALAAAATAEEFSCPADKIVEVVNYPEGRRIDPSDAVSISIPNWQLSRVLFDFDLAAIPATQFERLEKAVIRIDFARVDNPDRVPTVLGVLQAPWSGSEEKLGFGGAPWPSRGIHEPTGATREWAPGLLEFAYTPIPGAEAIVTAPGTVEFDVTSVLREQFYFGKPDFGFLLRTGPQHLTGQDNPGKWRLELTGKPQLQLTFAGVAPTVADQRARTLRYFPSAALPPVRNPYLFVFYNWGSEVNHRLWPRFRVFNTDGVFDDPALNQRGVLTLAARGGQQVEWPFDYDTYRADYGNCRFGIAIDEWQSVVEGDRRNPEFDHNTPMGRKIDSSIRALRDLKRERPELFVGIYWRGEISMRPLVEDKLPDLVLCEGYTRLPRFPQWEIGSADGIFHLDLARADGYYEQAINLHGTVSIPMLYPNYPRHFTPESIADEVRVLREKYPEVAGSGVYCEISPVGITPESPWQWNLDEAVNATWPVLEAYENALQKYFIDPAPEVRLTAPDFEAELHTPLVRIQAAAVPKDGRAIRQYRWFVDNRLVAETVDPEWIWDTRDTEPGRHMLTVHAIDSGWNRAAAWIPVTLQPAIPTNQEKIP